MHTDATSWEAHSLIASDRVEGTPVRSTDGTTIGTIERVMIDKLTGNVAYAVLSFNGFARTETFTYPLASAHLRSKTRGLSPRPHRKRTQRDAPRGRTSTGSVKSNATVILLGNCRKLVNLAGIGRRLGVALCSASMPCGRVRPVLCEKATML